MKNLAVAKPGSYIYCTFTVPKKMNFFYQTSFDKLKNTISATSTNLANSYYYFIAQGGLYPGRKDPFNDCFTLVSL